MSGKQNNLSDFFTKITKEVPDVFPAFLPAVVLFVLIPFAVYLPNQSMLNNNLALVGPYLVLAAICFILLLVFPFLVGEPWRTRIVVFLFYIGVYLGISDIIAPPQLGELMEGRESPGEPLPLSAFEVLLAVIVVFSAIKFPWKHVKRFGSIFVLLLLISEVIVVSSGLSPETSLHYSNIHFNTSENTAKPPENLAKRGNVYHITFDGYSGAIFMDSLEKMNLIEEFDGFTFFINNRSNYEITRASVASYMTGSFYEEGENLEEWREQHRSSGIANNLYHAGYEISMYAPTTWWVNEKASHIKTYEDMLLRYKSLSSMLYQFADIWLLRVVPNFLQQEVYSSGEGIFTRSFVTEDKLSGENAKIFASVQLMRQLIDDEAKRPEYGQYVYAHVHVPHPPTIMNRDCVFSSNSVDYNEQALCATRLMAEFISKLKELGRYEQATIIIQSDHGIGVIEAPDFPPQDSEIPLEVKKEMDALNPQGLPADKINWRTNALLLIKRPAQSGKPLAVSRRPTQLVDVPATVYDLLGLSARSKEGASVLSPDFPETREIDIFIGFMQQDEKGQFKEMGKGQLHHLSFTNGKGWKIYPDIRIHW